MTIGPTDSPPPPVDPTENLQKVEPGEDTAEIPLPVTELILNSEAFRPARNRRVSALMALSGTVRSGCEPLLWRVWRL